MIRQQSLLLVAVVLGLSVAVDFVVVPFCVESGSCVHDTLGLWYRPVTIFNPSDQPYKAHHCSKIQ
jgi:hypothetical protein